MEKFLFKIRDSWVQKKEGITITPGVECEMAKSILGAKLKIKRPDGNISYAYVSGLSPLCQHPDERIALCLSEGTAIEDVPRDSEVYLVELDKDALKYFMIAKRDFKGLKKLIAAEKGKELESLSYSELAQLSKEIQGYEVEYSGEKFQVEVEVERLKNGDLRVFISVDQGRFLEVARGYVFIKKPDGTVCPP